MQIVHSPNPTSHKKMRQCKPNLTLTLTQRSQWTRQIKKAAQHYSWPVLQVTPPPTLTLTSIRWRSLDNPIHVFAAGETAVVSLMIDCGAEVNQSFNPESNLT